MFFGSLQIRKPDKFHSSSPKSATFEKLRHEVQKKIILYSNSLTSHFGPTT